MLKTTPLACRDLRGTRLLFGANGARFRYQNIVVSAMLLSLSLPLHAQNTLALSSDGNGAAYIKDNALWLLQTRKSTLPEKIADVSDAYVTLPRWAPQSTRLAYYSGQSGALQLWMYDPRRRIRRQLTFVEGGIIPSPGSELGGFRGSPLRYSWSPDGSKIAFATQVDIRGVGAEVKEAAHHVFPAAEKLAAGEPVVLTPETPPEWTLRGVVSYGHVSADSYDDPNSRNTPHGALPPQTTQLFVLDVETGKVSQLTHDTAGYFTPEWSPDGRRLAYMSAEGEVPYRSTVETNIFTLHLETGEKRKITSGPTQKTLPLWSKDGAHIAYHDRDNTGTFVRKAEGVYLVRSDGNSPPRNVTPGLDRWITAFQWAPDQSAMLISYWDGLTIPLSRADIQTTQLSPVSAADAVVGHFGSGFASGPGGIVWTQVTDPNGSATLRYSDSRGKSQILVEVEAAADLRSERRYEVLHWTNTRKETIDGLLVYPSNYDAQKTYPLIVDAYGVTTLDIGRQGPDSYHHVNYVKAALNYFVFKSNHRAPHMWVNPLKGAVYTAAAVGPKGIAVMTDDILSGVEMLVQRGAVDPNRMCLAGFSNGAMQALQVLTRTNLFRCAMLQSPSPGDWLNYAFLNYPEDAMYFMHGIAPWEDPSIYTALTPLFEIDKIQTPVLLATGDREATVIATIEIYNALRFLKKDVTLLRYTTEGHGLTGEAEKDLTRRIGEFFSRYLSDVGAR